MGEVNPDVRLDEDLEVPIVDLGPFLSGDPAAFEPTARALRRASETLGFYFVANHGIAQPLIDRAFVEAERFHALPLEKKLAVRKTKATPCGYLPLGGQVQRAAKLDEAYPHRDLSASFYLRNEFPAGHPDRVAGRPWVTDNLWPERLPGFREGTLEYLAAVEALGYRLLELQSAALGLPRDFLRNHDAFRPAVPTLRLLHYPPRDPSIEGQYGIGPHTDYGYCTILAQARVPGLEILSRSGRWIPAPALDGHLLVNNSDMCRYWTNDRFRSAPHRVINASGRERYSIPVFFGVRPDVRLECLPTCHGLDNPPRYPPMSYAEHMRNIQKTNYELPD
jgi:isopenicillin N synthase-like dioxygenase